VPNEVELLGYRCGGKDVGDGGWGGSVWLGACCAWAVACILIRMVCSWDSLAPFLTVLVAEYEVDAGVVVCFV